jgi:thiol-disulfide isomerase/thioredoxin
MTKKALPLAALFAFAVPFAAIESTNAQPAAVAPSLKVGDAAPPFKVTEWYKGEAITMDQDKTYIVECWATWCGPCIRAFPHLSEIAKANEGKISVIGVNVWERKTAEEVKAFVEKQGDNMSYLVAADGDKVISEQWLKASGQRGIPCAYIVHKGKINWIGHPMGLKQELLDSIVAGTYDVGAAAKQKEQQQAFVKHFGEKVAPLIKKKDFAEAIASLEEMKKEFPAQEASVNTMIERTKVMMEKAAQQ